MFYGYLNFIKEKRAARAPFGSVARQLRHRHHERRQSGHSKATDEVNEYQYYLTNDRDFCWEVPQDGQRTKVRVVPRTWKTQPCGNTCVQESLGIADFSDPRLVRDGAFDQLISRYWSKVPPKSLTLITEAHALLKQTLDTGNKDMFKYMLHHMTCE